MKRVSPLRRLIGASFVLGLAFAASPVRAATVYELDYLGNGSNDQVTFDHASPLSSQYYFNVDTGGTFSGSTITGATVLSANQGMFCTDFTKALVDPSYAVQTTTGRWSSGAQDSEIGFSWLVFEKMTNSAYSVNATVAAAASQLTTMLNAYSGSQLTTIENEVESVFLWNLQMSQVNSTAFNTFLTGSSGWTGSTAISGGGVSAAMINAVETLYTNAITSGLSGYTALYFMPSDSSGNLSSSGQPMLYGAAQNSVPEPGTIALLAAGMATFLAPKARRRIRA